jgi:hypothetical protein
VVKHVYYIKKYPKKIPTHVHSGVGYLFYFLFYVLVYMHVISEYKWHTGQEIHIVKNISPNMTNKLINWQLVCALYEFLPGEITATHSALIEESLVQVGWDTVQAVTLQQYKYMWHLSVCHEPISDKQADREIQWGYKLIAAHFS